MSKARGKCETPTPRQHCQCSIHLNRYNSIAFYNPCMTLVYPLRGMREGYDREATRKMVVYKKPCKYSFFGSWGHLLWAKTIAILLKTHRVAK